MKLLLFMVIISGILTFNSDGQANNSYDYTIAFGSCAHQDRPQPIWQTIVKTKPQAFLFIGDNIYADTYSPKVMRAKYQQLARIPEFKEFRSQVPIFATWDDHDYGVNDAGAEYPLKAEAQRIFLDFWQGPDLPQRYERKGIYHSVSKQAMGLNIQLILLDTRYHRSELVKDEGGYTPNTSPEASMLGLEQWQWLEEELKKPADLRIIASSIQFLSSLHPYEKWNNFPLEREKMFQMIAKTRANGVVFISGDRHAGEISATQHPLIDYPIIDITSSGLTDSTKVGVREEANPFRIEGTKFHTQRNFGIIKISKTSSNVKLDLSLIDQQGGVIESHSVRLSDTKRKMFIDTIKAPIFLYNFCYKLI